MTERPSLQAWLLLILLALIWGSSFILIKKGLIGLSPMDIGALRILSAGLVLSPMAVRRMATIPGEKLKYLIIVGLSGSFIPAFLFAYAQTRIPSGLTGVLNSITPLFTVIVGMLIYQRKVNSSVFIGVFIGFLGSAILIFTGRSGGIGEVNAFALLIVLATIFYAVNSNVIKYNLSGISALGITSVSLAFGGLAALIYFLIQPSFFNHVMTSAQGAVSAGYIVLLGVMGTAIALIIFNKIVQLTDPVFTSSVTYLIPIVALIWGVLDGEALQPLHLFGVVLILSGVYLTNRLSKIANKKS